MIKVAIIVPSLMTGGAENMASQLATHINKKKFCIELLILAAPTGTALEKIIRDMGVKTVYFNKNLGFNLKTILKMYQYLNQFNPDVIHTHLSGCIYAIPWALIHGIKILHTIHSRPIYEGYGIIRRILKYLYHLKQAIPIAISDTIAKETIELYGVTPQMVETVYNPVDILKFSKVLGARVRKDEIIFANVARFSPPKNQMVLVESFCRVSKEIPTAKFVLIGDGETKSLVEERVKELKLEDKVEFTGNISNIPQRLANADIFVLPSQYEGLPLTILEAMAAGLPIIATRVGGIPDVVKENGILVEVGDIEGLTGAMIRLARDKILREKMGAISRLEAQKYDLTEICTQYEQLYKKYYKIS